MQTKSNNNHPANSSNSSSEINFYETDDELIKAVIALVLKIYSENKRVLIFSQNDELIKQLDASLWSFSKTKFLPHSTIFDAEFESSRQPIFLSNHQKNSNQSDHLIFFELPSPDFLNQFARSFFFYEQQQAQNQANQQIFNQIKPHNFFKKLDGKWVKADFQP